MIEVGEYIRDKEGNITKIINTLSLFKDVELYLGEDGYHYSDNAIKNHSKNIIDLIEVGDYVNGYKVEEVMEEMGTWKRFLEMTLNYTNKEIGDCTIREDKDIKTILTKESYMANCYKVGGENEQRNKV